VEGDSGSRVNALGQEEGKSGISVRLEDDTPENRLRQAIRVENDGNFPAAIDMYRTLADDAAAPAPVREEALYELGTAYAHPLNTHRDYEAAVQRLEQLLREFPDTGHRADTEANLEHYRALIAP